jgi:branched-chain amino acid transport system ATP-binding protein
MDELLRVEAISLAFGGLSVFRAVSFEVRPGELVALIGPNGAGKTSVLNCIGGLYQPSAGAIRFGATLLTGRKPHQIAALGVARTFQHAELIAHMNVVDNLLLGRHRQLATSFLGEALRTPLTRRLEAEHRLAVEEVIEFVELERHRHAMVDNLSFGLQKVVGFARALVMQPRLMLLDEPSAGLNREEKEDLARFILRAKHEKRPAMLWVEHDMQMVADLADRIVVLNYGELLADGTPASVLSDPRVVAAYLGTQAG